MLEEILMNLHNWFVVSNGKHFGNFSIKGGITLPFLQDGQYFRIIGSVFNDGLHQYPAEGLTDEDFDGAIWALAIPKNILDIAKEIEEYNAKSGDRTYTSESFGGYSYSKATNSNGLPVGWQEVFSAKLKPYRKIKGCE